MAGAEFTYRPAAAVSSVWPLSGMSEGGTPLTVLGGGFSSAAEAMGALLCRFNSTIVPAAYVSESALACNTTSLRPGHVLVEVSTNGREYTSSGVHFELVSVMMQDLTPWCGPVLGGTVVTIAGTGLSHAADSLHCQFGDEMLPVLASAHGSDGVRCVSPPSLPDGWSHVTITSHGVPLRSGGNFMAHLAMYVSELVPPAGPVSGGTRVTVLGGPFREVSTLRCRFEGSGLTRRLVDQLTISSNARLHHRLVLALVVCRSR